MPPKGEIHLLPPPGRRARNLALAVLALAPLAFGALAVALGQDANWDLRNYHWYNAYAFLNGRHGFDILPSQTPWFYNPVLDVPFYLLATHVPAVVAGFILGCVQGLNFILLFMLAHATLIISHPRNKVLACLGLAALGMLGGGGISQIGTTFYDNVTSLGIFLSALLTVRHFDKLMTASWRRAFKLAFLFGIPAGLMMGLKLPSVIFCVGLCFSFLFTGGPWHRRLCVSFAFGLGILLGLAVSLGHWMWFLQSHYGNPFFPYFNNVFNGPLTGPTSARDTQYIPRSVQDFLLFPFIFADSPYRTGEIEWRDWRIPILYVLLPFAVALRLGFGRAKNRPDVFAQPLASRYLLWMAVGSYLVWLRVFAIYRYAIPMEMIAPLLIVFAVGMLPIRLPMRGMLAAIVLVTVAASVMPGNWTRRDSWLDRFIEVKVPRIKDAANTMILMAGFEPYSHLVPALPAEIPVIRIESNFSSPRQNKGINAILSQRIEAHQGRLLILIPPWQHEAVREALRYFRLDFSGKPCQTVRDRLYHDKPMDLCPLQRLAPE
ncbi:MAG: hypothetical protein SFW62_09350 [Alphaproteobacteria bacterium]|nr:hypothetical protein [Alphaproteobacteria bacterium]